LTARRQIGRRWHKALALLAGGALVLGVSAAHVPGPWHRDDAPHACPICKLGYPPAAVASATLLVELPAPSRRLPVAAEQPLRLVDAGTSTAPRAPPA
jgi:hypothetical protein